MLADESACCVLRVCLHLLVYSREPAPAVAVASAASDAAPTTECMHRPRTAAASATTPMALGGRARGDGLLKHEHIVYVVCVCEHSVQCLFMLCHTFRGRTTSCELVGAGRCGAIGLMFNESGVFQAHSHSLSHDDGPIYN